MHRVASARLFAPLSLSFLFGKMGPELLPRRDAVGTRHSHSPGTGQGLNYVLKEQMTMEGILRAGPLGSLFLQDPGGI